MVVLQGSSASNGNSNGNGNSQPSSPNLNLDRSSSPTQNRKRRISNLFGTSSRAEDSSHSRPSSSRPSSSHNNPHSPHDLPTKPALLFYASPKPKDRKKALLSVSDVSQAFAVYPERPELINRSTLVKVEGTIGDEEMGGGMRSREGWVLVMPEFEPGGAQASEMLRWITGESLS